MLSKLFKSLFGLKEKVDFKSLIADGAMLVDVRNPDEFKSGHVKGSVNIPLNQVASQISQLKGKKQIIVFCQSGIRSRMAQSILNSKGISTVINGRSWKDINKYVS